MTTYFSVWFGSLVLALAVTPAVIALARRIDTVDRPGVRTVHTQPVPRIGGVAIFVSAVCLILVVLLLDNQVGDAFRRVSIQVSTLLGMAT
ncbi:MAG TPA: hypothetical protein PK316_21955, partial [Sedimentisphaerales bacterium]|nr:hypothetical protein [Sedimentisphaerales bacterium]